MTAVLHSPPIPRVGSGILINPSNIPILPFPNSTNSKRFSNTPSNNSLASSSSSSENHTDDTSNSHQSLSQSWSGAGAQLQNSVALSKGTRSSSTPSTRRIRFAPLPDPRALESAETEEIECDGAFLGGDNISSILDSSDAGCSSLSSSLVSSLPLSTSTSKESSCCSSASASCAPSPSGINVNTATAAVPSLDTDYPSGGSSPTIKKVSSGWASKPKKLFKPFLRRSSLPMPPASSSGFTTEDILTLGTIGLFRTSSRESRSATSGSSEDVSGSSGGGGSGWGSSLSRWTSSSTYTGQKNKSKEWLGSPLARTESTQSYKGDVRGRSAQPRPSPINSKPSTSAATQSAQNRKSRLKGTKMLNGRVYGGRRIDAQNTNLFATAKDEEPEFVEWGYGGMGSVKASVHGGSQWSRLQSDKAMSLGSAGAAEDDDDGGGMAWLKKRKEQRERAKQEAEEKTKLEAEAKASGVQTKEPETKEQTGDILVHAQAVPSPESKSESAAHGEDAEAVTAKEEAPVPPAPAPAIPPIDEAALSSPPLPSASSQEEHCIRTAVTVPALHRRVSHHRSNSANMSQASSMQLVGLEGERERTMSPLRSSSLEVEREKGKAKEVAVEEPQAIDDDNASLSGDSISSSGSNASDSDSEGGDDEDEDEPEDEDDEQIRKTALGAGVEKISRHKDER